MGGSNEKLVPSLPSKGIKVSSSIAIGKGAIRVHENNGEVHFHDDAAGLKTSVPSALFFNKWTGFKAEPVGKTISFDDAAHGTRTTIEGVTEAGVVDIKITIATVFFTPPSPVGPGFKLLNDFAEGK